MRKNGKKRALLCGMIAFALAICLSFLVLAGCITAALLGAIKSLENGTIPESPIACMITGTREGSALELTLTYDGLTIPGIKGTCTESGAFSAEKKKGGGKTKLPLPTAKGADLSVQTFMCYQAVTMKSSPQYKLLNGKDAKDDGLYRKVGGRYAVALGSFYGSTIGTEYTITFKQQDGSTKTIRAVLGDQKADKDTDEKHQYHKVDGSVVEFVTAAGTAKDQAAIRKTQQQINRDFGEVTAIYRGRGTDVKLKGAIKGSAVTVTGAVDGVPLSASGTIKDGKIRAEGFLGEDAPASGGGIYTGGKFTWPVPGWSRVSSDYGSRMCPFHGPETHSGIDIPASYGVNVVAAAGGTIVQAGDLGSYGNAIVISHGSGLFTLYGHNSSLIAGNGQKVSAGQTIAKIGSTGSSTGNHCHFEVRKGANSYGNHTSPWVYLKK